MDFSGTSVSVIGAGRSGIAAARILTLLGANVRLLDNQPKEKFDAERGADIRATGAEFIAGAGVAEIVSEGTELVVTSPGVPKEAESLQTAVRRGIPVWSEIELACRLTKPPIVAITGTNGKTTTTLLVAAMLEASGRPALICGNVSADDIKRTLIEAAWETRTRADNPVLVAEVSSFQLEWVEKFAPKVGILTNVMPDHLDRYRDFDDYADTKARLFAAQSASDWAITNRDNLTSKAIGERPLPGTKLSFTRAQDFPQNAPAAWQENEVLTVCLERNGTPVPILAVSELPETLPGAHSVENVLAAASAALILGAEPASIARAVRAFPGVAHRMEFVAEIDGIRYINNSMCTNVAAAICSLEAMRRPAVVIAGGAEKGLDFAPLTSTLREKVRHLILIGSAAETMERTFRAGGYEAISRAATLEAAVEEARRRAVSGDAVLLTPACASFDMFRDFEERGVAFRQIVRGLMRRA
jgi:UDP-N-acetylmuramoylalanine--D-glutamate ligase